MLNETVPTAGPFFLRAKFSIFTTGKVYNCDLSASKNIGARFSSVCFLIDGKWEMYDAQPLVNMS